MPRNVFRLELDTPQRRILDDLIALTAGFSDWREAASENVYFEPSTRTVILSPTPYHPEWRTTGNGIYARFRKGDYWIGSPTGHTGNQNKWTEHDRGMVAGDFFLCNQDTNETIYTVSHYPVNTGFYLSYYAVNVGNERWVQIEFGWGKIDAEGSVSCRIWSDGEIEIWKGGARVGTGRFSDGTVSNQTSGANVDLLLLPWRRRELLISSNQGGAYNHAFADLVDDIDNQIVLPAGQFWWRVPEGSAQVQLHKVRYRTSGSAVSRKCRMRYAPAAGRSFNVRSIGFDNSFPFTGTLRNVANSADFAANGSAVEGRVRVNLTGDELKSPWLNGAVAMCDPVFTTTPDQAIDLTATAMGKVGIAIDVPDDPSGVRLTCTIRDENGYENLEKGTNRAARLYYGEQVVMELRSEPVAYVLGSSESAKSSYAQLEFRDIWKGLEKYTFSDDIPLDQMNLADAFRFFFAFVTEETPVIDEALETYPIVATDGDEDFSAQVKVGDSPDKWIRKLHEDYCGDMFLGMKPTADGYVPHVIKLDRNRPQVHTSYLRVADVGDFPAEYDVSEFLVRTYELRRLEPEANIVHVTGWDPAARAPIFTIMEDKRSTDPRLGRDDRPLNHLGEPYKFGLIDPSLTRLSVCEKVCQTYYDKITWPRWLIDTTAPLQVFSAVVGETILPELPLWRGDAWLITGQGVFEVTGFSAELIVEKDTWVRRRASYSGEFLYNSEVSEDALTPD